MIIYCTKQMMKDYDLKIPEDMISKTSAAIAKSTIEKEKNDDMLKWAAKSFEFDGQLSVIFMNLASKLTVVYPGCTYDDVVYMGHVLASYIIEIYKGRPGMKRLLERFYEDHQATAFDKLTDKSAIAALNSRLVNDMQGGELLYDYIDKDAQSGRPILHSIEFNKDLNWKQPAAVKINGAKEYVIPAEYFETLLRQRYKIKTSPKKR